mgnify:CR=1 FL=1
MGVSLCFGMCFVVKGASTLDNCLDGLKCSALFCGKLLIPAYSAVKINIRFP